MNGVTGTYNQPNLLKNSGCIAACMQALVEAQGDQKTLKVKLLLNRRCQPLISFCRIEGEGGGGGCESE